MNAINHAKSGDDVVSKEMNIRGLESQKAWDYENGYFWFSSPYRMNKFLAHYEIYKMIANLPGDILEFGVFKGLSLIRFATFRNLLENDFSRGIVGFDAFGEFPTEGLSNTDDLDFVERFEDEAGNGLSAEEIAELLSRKNFQNTRLIKGNVFDTLPQYLAQNPATKVSLLHLDMDVLEPTEFVLNEMFDRVVKGGVILLDDYPSVAGAVQAVDRFLEKTGLEIQKLPFSAVPSFVIKTA